MNTACMIELKKEYTILLCNVLTPIILEGLQHLYNESKKNSTKNNILKTFQLLLKSIPSWDSDIIRKEIERINFKTKEYPWIVSLIQSIFKLNILINGLEPSESMKKDIDMSLFIHSIYIECARQFWMDPFLFYHEYSSLEQKKNYCEIMRIIGCSIENAIRRLLPLSAIFDKFLGEKVFDGKSLDLFEAYNMPLLLDIPIEPEPKPEPKQEPMKNIEQSMPVQENIFGGGLLINPNIIPNINPNIIPNNMMIGGNNINLNHNETNENNINEKILNIINKNNVLTESNDYNNNFTVNNHSAIIPNNMPNNMQNNMQNNIPNNIPNNMPNNMQNNMPNNMPNNMNRHHSDRKSSSTLKRIVHESIKQSHNTATRTHSNASNNSDIKNRILKDLDSETITYNPEENAENYQDIFSNSDVKHTINTNEKAEKKSREKFFNNYLNI